MIGAAPQGPKGSDGGGGDDGGAETSGLAEADAGELHGVCAAAKTASGAHRAVLILGPPGAGKSSLALALIARGGILVADDRVALRRSAKGALIASPTDWHRRAALQDVIESRGLGLLRLPSLDAAPIMLVLRLLPPVAEQAIGEERAPQQRGVNLCLCKLPLIETRYSGALADGLYCLLQCGALLDPDAPQQTETKDDRT